MSRDTTEKSGNPLRTTIRPDGTSDCSECAMPLMPVDAAGEIIVLECANRHRAEAPAPTDKSTAAVVASWISRRGNQMFVQRERRAREIEEDAVTDGDGKNLEERLSRCRRRDSNPR